MCWSVFYCHVDVGIRNVIITAIIETKFIREMRDLLALKNLLFLIRLFPFAKDCPLLVIEKMQTNYLNFLEARIISIRMVNLNRFWTLVCYLNLAATELTRFVGPHRRSEMEFCAPSKLQGSITLLEIKNNLLK